MYKVEKSLCGLKQSGGNWSKMLHDYLSANQFKQNAADRCVYTKKTENEKVFLIIIIRVDDSIIAARDENTLKRVKETLAAKIESERRGKVKTFHRRLL